MWNKKLDTYWNHNLKSNANRSLVCACLIIGELSNFCTMYTGVGEVKSCFCSCFSVEWLSLAVNGGGEARWNLWGTKTCCKTVGTAVFWGILLILNCCSSSSEFPCNWSPTFSVIVACSTAINNLLLLLTNG